MLAVDEKRHDVLELQWEAGELWIVERIPVSRYPVNIAVSPDASRCTVASLWSRTITTFAIKPAHGMTEFNPPSLRGVSQGYSFFHDGRATKLEDVFVTHRHPYREVMPDNELADLLRFLGSL